MINESELLEQFAEMEIPELREAARAVTGWAIDSPEYGNARNVSGLRVDERVFSRRLDSRTAFASDNRYGPGGVLGAWTGSDRRAAAALRRVLRALSVPHAEIAGVDVQAEFGQVAEVISEADVRLEQPELLRKLARGTRAIGGIPVWSSYALVGLTAKAEIGLAEVHWPELASSLLREAARLTRVVERGLEMPEVDAARLESIDVGVVHSPAIGFSLDAAPAIRAIYAPLDDTLGKKTVRYLDRHLQDIDPLRTISTTAPDAVNRPRVADVNDIEEPKV